MDRALPKKTWNRKRITMVAGGVAILALILASYYFTSGNARFNVEAERITISEVREDSFREFIPVNGTVLPITSIFLDASVGSSVEEKYVEDGAKVKKGYCIMRHSNTDLELNLVTQETQVYNNLTQMQIAQTAAQQSSINIRNQMADAENALKEAKRLYDLNKTLYEQK